MYFLKEIKPLHTKIDYIIVKCKHTAISLF